MKNLFIIIFSSLVCLSGFAQDVEKRYFESNPDIGGDAVIKSSSFKAEKDGVYKTFEVEVSEAGAYYLDAWIVAPYTREGYAEYKLAVNGVLTEFSFKPQTDDWHSLTLTDAKKSASTVKLLKGVNKISIIGKGPEIPNVEFIKLSSNLSRSSISDSKYRQFIESIRNNTFNEVYNIDATQVNSTRGTNGEIYDYCLNVPVFYTTKRDFNFSAGQTVNITINPSIITIIDIYKLDNPETYSWSKECSYNTAGLLSPVISISIPESGIYTISLRLPPSILSKSITDLKVNNTVFYNSVVMTSFATLVTAGYPTPANFFTCKIANGGDTRLLLEDNSGKIRAFNDDGGTTSDGYSWGVASRITTNMTNITKGHVFAESSNNPVSTCDLYMGLAPVGSYTRSFFTNLPADNSFRSGIIDGSYNCISWSVGNNLDWLWASSYGISNWDDFYSDYGYTRIGATADNAAIALWVEDDIFSAANPRFTHASVRKNSEIAKPHGFEWESKCGDLERVMHTRDAVSNNGDMYGKIAFYYKPKNGTVNSSSINSIDNSMSTRSLSASESRFSQIELNQIVALSSYIPNTVVSVFEEKYLEWKKTWSRPEIAIYSDPYKYAESIEYENLLKYCLKYGKAIWPLIIDKVAVGEIFTLNLFRDLSYNDTLDFIDYIRLSASKEAAQTSWSLNSNLVNYCKGLLAKEETNILNSIRNITNMKEDESFEVNISITAQDILLKLYSVKEENVSVLIYNVFGGLEYEARYNILRGNQTLVISTSNFNKGIYVVKVTAGEESISKTIGI